MSVCARCGADLFPGRRVDAKWCSDACRMRAARSARKRRRKGNGRLTPSQAGSGRESPNKGRTQPTVVVRLDPLAALALHGAARHLFVVLGGDDHLSDATAAIAKGYSRYIKRRSPHDHTT